MLQVDRAGCRQHWKGAYILDEFLSYLRYVWIEIKFLYCSYIEYIGSSGAKNECDVYDRCLWSNTLHMYVKINRYLNSYNSWKYIRVWNEWRQNTRNIHVVSQRFPQIIEDFDQQINRISIVIGDILPIVIHPTHDNVNQNKL